MEKAWKFVLNPLKSENNYASADSNYAVGALVIIGILSVVSLGVKLFSKAKKAISRRKHRNKKISHNQTRVAHA